MILYSNSEDTLMLMFDLLPGLLPSLVLLSGDSSPLCLTLRRPAELEARLDGRWDELGLADIGTSAPDPALFGNTLEHVLERLAGQC
jgi:hypothetical protein